MFDISLGELSVIGAVALIVLGPEKLPKVARAAGLMLGRAQRMAADFRSDLERDLHNSELADLAKQVSDEEAQVRQQLAAVTAGMQQAVAEVESMHYGDPDPELEEMENRRYGGADSEPDHADEASSPYHDEIDPELQALDLQRYGELAEESSQQTDKADQVEPSGAETIPPASVPETAHQTAETKLPNQPDLFAAPVAVALSEKDWHDRR